MSDELIDRELRLVWARSRELLDSGHVSGVRDPDQTAIHMAVLEHLNEMAGSEIVELLRHGLNEALVQSKRREVQELARDLLVTRAKDRATTDR